MNESHTPVIALKQLSGNEPTSLNAFQQALLPYEHMLITGWFTIWCITALVLLMRLFREYLAHQKRQDR